MIYLDHSATTYVDVEVKKEMDRYFSEEFGNPSSMHRLGLKAKSAVDESRKKIAKILNCLPEEIIFTSGGTESISLALQGLAKEKKSGHLITSKPEHHAVLRTCEALEKIGFDITYLNVDKFGRVNPEDVKNAIKKNTILISIIYANNEIGTINPIKEIGLIAKKDNIPFHTDACQAGLLNLNVKELNVDLMTLNGSKIYGPKGVGILYKKKNLKIQPVVYGGNQEFGLRSGTENVPGIVGLAKALELIQKNKEEESARLIKLRNRLIAGLQKIPKTILNGHPTERLPNNVNFSFADVEGESIVLQLNELGIYVSTGSACTSKELEPSHVLLATGQSAGLAHGSIRFSLGRKTTEKEIDDVLEKVPEVIEKLRKISPIHLVV